MVKERRCGCAQTAIHKRPKEKNKQGGWGTEQYGVTHRDIFFIKFKKTPLPSYFPISIAQQYELSPLTGR